MEKVQQYAQQSLDWITDTAAPWVGDKLGALGGFIKEQAGKDGNYNFLFFIPGAVMGFLLALGPTSNAFGGGIFSTIAALPVAVAAAVGAGVLVTRGGNSLLAWAKDELSEQPSAAPAQQQAQAVQASPATEVALGDLPAPPHPAGQQVGSGARTV